MMARGERGLDVKQWLAVTLLALLIFVGDYGLLFWAEQRVPSGVAAVMMATHSGVYGAGGDPGAAHAEVHRRPGSGARHRHRRRGGAGEPLAESGWRADQSRGRRRAYRRVARLVDRLCAFAQTAPAFLEGV